MTARLHITAIRELSPAELDAESLRQVMLEHARRASRGNRQRAAVWVCEATNNALRAGRSA